MNWISTHTSYKIRKLMFYQKQFSDPGTNTVTRLIVYIRKTLIGQQWHHSLNFSASMRSTTTSVLIIQVMTHNHWFCPIRNHKGSPYDRIRFRRDMRSESSWTPTLAYSYEVNGFFSAFLDQSDIKFQFCALFFNEIFHGNLVWAFTR